MLGRDVCEAFADHSVITKKHAELDITDADSIRIQLSALRPHWVINCAAFTAVDACEENEAEATLINGDAPGYIASACREVGAKLVHISTDYVFDGTKDEPYHEDDPVCPVNAYGRGKLKGELSIASNMDDYIIVRAQWLFGEHGPNFVKTILKAACERDELQVVNDQWGSPTFTPDLAQAILKLIEADARGLFHVSSDGYASWFDLAKEALIQAGISTPIQPVGSEKFPRPARRPANSRLYKNKYEKVAGAELPRWQDGLRRYLREIS